MEKVQVRSAVGILALVVVGGAAFALVSKKGHGRADDEPSGPSNTSSEGAAPENSAPAPEPPVKLGSIGVPNVREYFIANGYRFEDKVVPGNAARVIGTAQNGQTMLEFIGSATLERATLSYELRDGALNGQDMHAVMYMMQNVKAGEDDVRWAIEAVRKGEPVTRTIGAVVYAVQRTPGGTNEFVMRPAPGFE
jgi:hypothetical protein